MGPRRSRTTLLSLSNVKHGLVINNIGVLALYRWPNSRWRYVAEGQVYTVTGLVLFSENLYV